MQKIVINVCFGGFGLSKAAENWLREKYDIEEWDGERNDSRLVECVETLGGPAASDGFAKLKIVEVPERVRWEIAEYDGYEHVAECHQTWS